MIKPVSTNPDLWARIEATPLIRQGDGPFIDRLLKKFGGSIRKQLERGVEEYRRFLYLGVILDGDVTPSNLVDEIWHEHILFTQEYFIEWPKVLGRLFHHVPTVGEGRANDNRRYVKTLTHYFQEFAIDDATIKLFWPH